MVSTPKRFEASAAEFDRFADMPDDVLTEGTAHPLRGRPTRAA